MKKKIKTAIAILFALFAFYVVSLLSGCGHNISVQGFGLATPAGAVGYGSFNCVRENVSFENTRQKNGNDFQEISRLKVEKQK